MEGFEYPLVKLEISRTSHPYYTGKTKLVDTAGRIDKFKNRYAGLSLNKNSEQTPAEDTPVAEEAPAEDAPVAEEAAPVEEVRQQVEASKPAQVVAGASRSSPGSSKKVKLSKEDIRLANKWDIPLEQYALEKQKSEQADGEYTTINMQRGGRK